jgi:hypothetical protein
VIVGLLALAAVNARVLISQGRTATIEQAFSLSEPVNANDWSFSEVSIALSRIPRHRVNEYPGEDLVSIVTAPFPRALVPFKPISGTVQFTEAFDPARWRKYESGLTIGAVNEVQYDYPYPVAVLVIALLGAAWAFAFRKSLQSKSIHGFAWSVGFYVAAYNFFRNDLYIMGAALSVFVIYGAIVLAYQQLKRGSLHAGRTNRGRPRVVLIRRA